MKLAFRYLLARAVCLFAPTYTPPRQVYGGQAGLCLGMGGSLASFATQPLMRPARLCKHTGHTHLQDAANKTGQVLVWHTAHHPALACLIAGIVIGAIAAACRPPKPGGVRAMKLHSDGCVTLLTYHSQESSNVTTWKPGSLVLPVHSFRATAPPSSAATANLNLTASKKRKCGSCRMQPCPLQDDRRTSRFVAPYLGPVGAPPPQLIQFHRSDASMHGGGGQQEDPACACMRDLPCAGG